MMSAMPELGEMPMPQLNGEAGRRAWSRFQGDLEKRLKTLAPPSRRDERWRFADLKGVRWEALDGDLSSALETQGGQAGLTRLSLAQALERDGDLVMRLLENLRGPLGSEYFVSRAFLQDLEGVTCLWVEPGVAVEEPVILERTCAAGDGAGYAVTLLVAGPGASVQVLERFRGSAGSRGSLIAATGMDAGAGARVGYTVTQELPKAMQLVHCAHLELGRDASGELALINAGASWVRQEAAAALRETGASAKLLGLNLMEGSDYVDQHTRQRHIREHGTSDLLFKNAVFDQARVTFGGLIQVEEGAHYTDAYQSCRNLLLSDEAEANAMPGLEINADQVRCSHGATTGRIDPEELFYLRARGIGEEAARQLITLGFANDVVDRIGEERIRGLLRELVEGRLLRRRAAGG